MQKLETTPFKTFVDILDILDREGMSRSPKHTGYGIEIYEDNNLEVQVLVNWRNNEITVTRGF